MNFGFNYIFLLNVRQVRSGLFTFCFSSCVNDVWERDGHGTFRSTAHNQMSLNIRVELVHIVYRGVVFF